MSSYHKPKIYRSLDGCCICKAKSSSSRFTDSQKYESEFSKCFRLEESREGDICNACVLIVKRWRRLPEDTKKHWAHVVDARNGPGNKQTNKQKKKEDQIEMFEKIRKKRKTKKIIKMQRAGITTGVAVKQNTASNTFDVPDFIDLSYWKRLIWFSLKFDHDFSTYFQTFKLSNVQVCYMLWSDLPWWMWWSDGGSEIFQKMLTTHTAKITTDGTYGGKCHRSRSVYLRW